EGRTSYAEETAGGYYAARLGVLEKLRKKQRQAKALVLREVTDEYWAPLGVWVVRETVREALEKEPINPESFKKAVEKAKKRISVPMKEIKEKSKLMKAQQSDIKKFMRKKE
ncbi:MAG: hypothetical protein MUP58_01695, partial [Candidatus Nanohaloarchaeota archaeon QJJ-9]|nr:hypothetical protein [Candidatus Nanohaloarchaeota archaeon QJJ-9]